MYNIKQRGVNYIDALQSPNRWLPISYTLQYSLIKQSPKIHLGPEEACIG